MKTQQLTFCLFRYIVCNLVILFKISSILLMLISNLLSAQMQRNLLFNSNSNIVRLDFNTATPIPYATGVAGSYEGIVHYEDESGNILFWFNSTGVYDQNNTFMAGSFGILANSSSAEICVCPVPGSPNRYYILYNTETCSNLYYSIVDMNLNGGLGDVVELNTLIDSGDFAEGMEVVQIPETGNYWFLTYQCGVGFTKFYIGSWGIGPAQIFLPYPMPAGGYDGRCEFDYHRGKIGVGFAWSSQVFLSDFDPVNGDVCDTVTLSSPEFNNNPFGVDFSPTANKMYFSLWYTTGVPNLFQYNFETDTYTSFQPPLGGSGWISGLGQIELGRNGKLYIIEDGGSNIIVINNPDDDVPVFSLIPIPSTTGLGISDHIQSFVFDNGVDYNDTLCAPVGSSLILTPDEDVEYWWATAVDPFDTLFIGSSFSVSVADSFISYIANKLNATNCFSLFNQYQWSVYPQPDVNAGPDVTIQLGQNTVLDANTGVQNATSIYWYPPTGLNDPFSTNPIASPTVTTTYTLTVQNGPCQGTDQVTVTVNTESFSETICVPIGTQPNLMAPDTMINVLWFLEGNPGNIIGSGNSFIPPIMEFDPITYVASGYGANSLIGMQYEFTLMPGINLGANFNICIDDMYFLNELSSGYIGTWSGEGVFFNLFFSDNLLPGIYPLTFTLAGSSVCNTATVNATVLNPIDTSQTIVACDGFNYQVSFFIEGGLPPYSINGNIISGNLYNSPTLSGITMLNVADAQGCELPMQFSLNDCTNIVGNPCNLVADMQIIGSLDDAGRECKIGVRINVTNGPPGFYQYSLDGINFQPYDVFWLDYSDLLTTETTLLGYVNHPACGTQVIGSIATPAPPLAGCYLHIYPDLWAEVLDSYDQYRFFLEWMNGSYERTINLQGIDSVSVLITDTITGCQRVLTSSIPVQSPEFGVFYPNPNHGGLFYYTLPETLYDQPIGAEVFNVAGQLVADVTPQTDADHTFSIDLRLHGEGMFIIRLQIGNRVEVHKVVVWV